MTNIEPALLIVDDIDLSIQAVLGGVGLAYLLYDYVAADVVRGRLVTVLEDWTPSLSGFFLYYSNRKQMTPALRALIDFLKIETKKRGISPMAPPNTRISRNYLLVGKGPRRPRPARLTFSAPATKSVRSTSALGHKRTFSEICSMSALPPKADIQLVVVHIPPTRIWSSALVQLISLQPEFPRRGYCSP